MFFDFKISVWERIKVSSEFEEIISRRIQSGKIKTGNDIFTEVEELSKGISPDREVLHETETHLSPEQNEYQATIEIVTEEEQTIWNNSKPEANPFPNGFDSWQETHFEIVSKITSLLESGETSEPIEKIQKEQGHGGLYELAKEMTIEFERKYDGRDWADGDYFDTVEEFINEKLYLQS